VHKDGLCGDPCSFSDAQELGYLLQARLAIGYQDGISSKTCPEQQGRRKECSHLGCVGLTLCVPQRTGMWSFDSTGRKAGMEDRVVRKHFPKEVGFHLR
jgi:hypothetical protein